ncbi:MAG: nitroreductase family protein [Deltaproteobacteria bacterium]|jgi:nitroreductase|nr:nitroreductase family protein [Deltaproteobacteria bacterium]
MNEVLKALRERRSIRSFTGLPVSDEDLKTVLDITAFAPTSRNSQAFHITVIKGLDNIAKLNKEVVRANQKPGYERYQKSTASPGYSINFHSAPVFLTVGVDPTKTNNPREDGALVLAYILLAAHSLGLGACWINQLGLVGDEPEFRAYLTALGFPTAHTLTGSACLGHPAQKAGLPDRTYGRFNIVG